MNQNDALAFSEIRIDWSMQSPGLDPKSWVIFDSLHNPAKATQSGVEEELSWPAGTLQALEIAFEKRLSRSTGWNLTKLGVTAPFEAAARVFKRGVLTSLSKRKTLSGHYSVQFSQHLEPLMDLPQDAALIMDKNVSALWGIKPRPDDLVLDLNETTKNLETVSKITKHISRINKPIIIIGGGILADTGAFSAALLGKAFTLFPTTLLAMVDACVGGKTGVNFGKHGKNQLGLFAFPESVIIQSAWLKTLPIRELKAGLAESYKHAVISGDQSFAEEIAHLDPTPDLIKPYLRRLIDVKAQIIQEDPNEAGKRAVLNFGHTLAHALETISQKYNSIDPLLHGEAIAIGMRFALHLSHQEGHLPGPLHDQLQHQLRQAKFMISKKDFERHLGKTDKLFPEILDGILQDKKNIGDRQTTEWVLLKGFGEFVQSGNLYTAPVKIENIKKSWETFITQEALFS